MSRLPCPSPKPVFSNTPRGASVSIRVTPRAGRSELTGIVNGHLTVRLAAAPVENAANEALLDLLAATLGVPKRSVVIASGHHGRMKRVVFPGFDAADLEARLANALR